LVVCYEKQNQLYVYDVYILGQGMDDLWKFLQVIVFQCLKDFYLHISLGMFVNCPMMVEIGKCNKFTYIFFSQNLMWTTIHFHFEKTHFVIICYNKILWCCVWDGNL